MTDTRTHYVWRDEINFRRNYHVKKFAFLPVKLEDTGWNWLCEYYQHRVQYGKAHYIHIDYMENISVYEYLLRVLAGTDDVTKEK